MAADAGGLPIQFSVSAGELHDCKEAPEFVAKLSLADYMIADKGYDSEPLRFQIRDQGAIPVIPRKQNSTVGNEDMNGCLDKYHQLVENLFARLKHFRTIATRYDKLKCNFAGAIALVCAFIWLPMLNGNSP